MVKREDSTIETLASWGAIEAKFAADAVEGEIEGYASLFGELDQGNDVVVAGAFAKCLKDRRLQRIPLFFGHAHSSVPIGVLTSLKEDGKGLPFKAKVILETPEARQVRAIMLAGGEMGVSIGYRTVKQAYRVGGKEYDEWQPNAVRLLKEVDLREISLTAMPMLDNARITKVKDESGVAADEAARPLILAIKSATDHLEIENALRRATAALSA